MKTIKRFLAFKVPDNKAYEKRRYSEDFYILEAMRTKHRRTGAISATVAMVIICGCLQYPAWWVRRDETLYALQLAPSAIDSQILIEKLKQPSYISGSSKVTKPKNTFDQDTTLDKSGGNIRFTDDSYISNRQFTDRNNYNNFGNYRQTSNRGSNNNFGVYPQTNNRGNDNNFRSNRINNVDNRESYYDHYSGNPNFNQRVNGYRYNYGGDPYARKHKMKHRRFRRNFDPAAGYDDPFVAKSASSPPTDAASQQPPQPPAALTQTWSGLWDMCYMVALNGTRDPSGVPSSTATTATTTAMPDQLAEDGEESNYQSFAAMSSSSSSSVAKAKLALKRLRLDTCSFNVIGWQKGVIGLLVFSFLFGALGVVLAFRALCVSALARKIYYYHSAGEIFFVSGMCTAAGLFLYPLSVEFNLDDIPHKYGWAYGLCWVSSFLFFLATICMMLDELVRYFSKPFKLSMLLPKCCVRRQKLRVVKGTPPGDLMGDMDAFNGIPFTPVSPGVVAAV